MIPKRCVRATVEHTDNRKIILTGWYREDTDVQIDIRSHVMNNNFLSDLDAMNEQTLRCIGQSIQAGTLKVISDGSYLDTHRIGTAAWILETPDGTVTSGRMIIPGHEDVQGSYRSELGGMYGGLTHVALICKKLDITEGQIILGCDGLGAVQIIDRDYAVTKSNTQQFDIIRAINTLR